MRRGTRGAWIMAVLAVLGATIVVGPEARASVTTLPLNITGGIKTVNPDPIDQLIFQVTLAPFNSIYDGDHFTISGLPSYATIEGTTQPSVADPSDPDGFTFAVSWNPLPGKPNLMSVTWVFTGDSPILPSSLPQVLDPSPNVLDKFSITISIPDKDPNLKAGQSLTYSYVIDKRTVSSTSLPGGTPPIVLASIVPEPSSSAIVLLSLGTAGLYGLVRAGRRRWARTA